LEGAAAVLGLGLEVEVADPALPAGFEEEELPGLSRSLSRRTIAKRIQ
jgi:hypothetical protein